MALFGFGKKKEEAKEKGCCCGGACNAEALSKAEAGKQEGASVKVLGSGCAKCNELEAAAREALTELGMDTTIDHVTDFAQIAAYGVMTTPALVVDGKVVCFGKVLKKDEVISLLKEAQG
ncbi:thioredoxin family protein [Eisenbergiella sp.]